MTHKVLCHGCAGKGWVSPTPAVAVLCPVCEGAGVVRVADTNQVYPTPSKLWRQEGVSWPPMQFQGVMRGE